MVVGYAVQLVNMEDVEEAEQSQEGMIFHGEERLVCLLELFVS